MRTYGRVKDSSGNLTIWTEVQTDSNGDSSYVWITTLIQCLKLVTNESPFYANYGIASPASVMQQIFPDFDMIKTQQQFAQYFASLVLSKQASTTPTYNISLMTNNGAQFQATIAG